MGKAPVWKHCASSTSEIKSMNQQSAENTSLGSSDPDEENTKHQKDKRKSK